jgi:type I restriction enzyme M protein
MKPAERSARILMVDATKILTQKRAQNILSPEDVDHIYQLYLDYKDVEDYSKVVTLKEIEDKEFNLSPNRYVNYHRKAIRPYEEVKREFLEAIEAVKLAEQEFTRLIEN